MKICRLLFHLLLGVAAVAQTQPKEATLPEARVLSLTIGSEKVTLLHVRPGYVSSVRLPEEVSSVVIGDPRQFSAEHSEAEPRLVFLKPISLKPSETNVLITTKSGHEIPLHIINDGRSSGGEVDFFLDYERPRSFLVPETAPHFIVGESRVVSPQPSPISEQPQDSRSTFPGDLLREPSSSPKWHGQQLQVGIGDVKKSGQRLIVEFSVLNRSDTTVELLPPQVQLSGPSKQRHGTKTKAEQITIDDYRLSSRSLAPGQRVEGMLIFERPAFKESTEHLLLQVAQVDQVDRPVLVPIAFTPEEGGAQ